MTKGKNGGIISYYKKCFAGISTALSTFSIDEIKSGFHDEVKELIKEINEREIGNKTLERILICIDKKKYKGENRNEEMKKITITYILEKYREIKKTNEKKDLILLAEQIFSIYGMLRIKSIKKKIGTYN